MQPSDYIYTIYPRPLSSYSDLNFPSPILSRPPTIRYWSEFGIEIHSRILCLMHICSASVIVLTAPAAMVAQINDEEGSAEEKYIRIL